MIKGQGFNAYREGEKGGREREKDKIGTFSFEGG